MHQPIQIENEVQFLDAKCLKIRLNSFEDLEVELPDGSIHTPVVPVRALPLSQPDQFILFLDADENEIGIIEDIKQLNKADRNALEAELEKCYFIPKITQIHAIDGHFGVTQWEVETDRGPAHFDLRSRHDIRLLEDGRILIKDVDGVRYEIANFHRLDAHSIALLETQI